MCIYIAFSNLFIIKETVTFCRKYFSSLFKEYSFFLVNKEKKFDMNLTIMIVRSFYV